MTFEVLLKECNKLRVDDLAIFIDILTNQAREKRRAQIRREALKVRADVKAGKKFKTLDDLLNL